ncbi:hypothetical protein SESBI_30458 [Sesbania bispinosa]|nr:hypothetical protein SESBI_30458 [Sesbania bispinosa]
MAATAQARPKRWSRGEGVVLLGWSCTVEAVVSTAGFATRSGQGGGRARARRLRVVDRWLLGRGMMKTAARLWPCGGGGRLSLSHFVLPFSPFLCLFSLSLSSLFLVFLAAKVVAWK